MGSVQGNQWDRPIFHIYATGPRVATRSSRGCPYATTRRKLALVCVALGGPEGERYTLHSPKNLLPTAANQLKFDRRDLNIIGHCSTTSKIPERYDRGTCANELLLRNTVIRRMRSGWNVAPAFRLPEMVVDTTRIGREK